MPFFQFALGPVQGFVAQARRTRDFWAGSFLVSWLSGVAIDATLKQQGEIVFPTVAPTPDRHRNPGVPNRFEAKVPPAFDPGRVVNAVRCAWLGLSELVWNHDLDPLGDAVTKQARLIWERQVSGFWEIQWVMREDQKDRAALGRRKHWRGRLLPDEPGLSCDLVEGWQELSGAFGPTDPVLTGFWEAVRQRLGADLDPREHLSAIGFIKRRFALSFDRLHDVVDGDLPVNGWRLDEIRVPSVYDIAARVWKASVLEVTASDPSLGPARRLADAIGTLTGRKLQSIPGEGWFLDAILDADMWSNPDREAMARASKALQEIQEILKRHHYDPQPPKFYAILLMDGDEMGRLLGRYDSATVSDALGTFTASVFSVIEDHKGWTVYAGGDDVLAFLPLESALTAAATLRTQYVTAFRARGVADATISAAVVFVHVKVPLGSILAHAHDLLDRVAKEAHGRDALACQVWTPGGASVTWAMPWEAALSDEDTPWVAELAQKWAGRQEEMEGMTSSLLYRFRERWAIESGPNIDGLSVDEIRRIVVADFLHAGENRMQFSIREAEEVVDRILRQCQDVRRQRPSDNEPAQFAYRNVWSAAGALLIRFLATKGSDRR